MTREGTRLTYRRSNSRATRCLEDTRGREGSRSRVGCANDRPCESTRYLLYEIALALEPPTVVGIGLTDRVNRKHRSVEHARDPVGQRLDALGVKVLVEQHFSERANRRVPLRSPTSVPAIAFIRFFVPTALVIVASMPGLMPARTPYGKNNLQYARNGSEIKSNQIAAI